MLFTAYLSSPLGRLTLASDGGALTGLWLAGQKYYMAGLPDTPAREAAELPVFRAAADWLEAYFAGRRPDPGLLPLSPAGSAFRRAVWGELLAIPYGRVTTYGAIAGRLGKPAQAVGGAVGHNPLSILIPCHRVVGADGALTGYAGGLEAKAYLLRLEGVPLTAEGKAERNTIL